MESDLIYIKTATGEEAIRQRTRVIQRNMRMVLILVDGHSTVGEISLKTGNPQLTENALLELEKGGFVELRVDDDSIWAESKKVAQEIRDSAINKIHVASAPLESEAKSTILEARIPVNDRQSSAEPVESSFSSFSIIDQQTNDALSLSVMPAEIGERPRVNSEGGGILASLSSFFLILKVLYLRFKNKSRMFLLNIPLRRGRQNAANKPMKIGLFVFSLFAIGIISLLFFPYKIFLPEVEAAFSQITGRPVRIATINVSFYPKPGILLGGVRIGLEKDEFRITEVRLIPELEALSAEKKILRDVTVNGVSLPVDRMALIAGVISASRSPTALIGVKQLHFENTDILFGGLNLSAMEGRVILGPEGEFRSLMLRNADRSANLEFKPQAQRFDAVFEGYAWRPVPGSPYVFDTVNLKGEIQNGLLTIKDMELRIFDGLIKGVAILQTERKPGIAGEITFERINASRFGDALGIGQQFSGEAFGKIRFSMTAETWTSLFSALNAEGEFGINRGKIRGIDLAEAVRRVSGTPVQGGVTNFEQLTGKLRLTPGNYQFSSLVMNSGLMQSSGIVELNKDLMLSGRMDLQMRGTVNQSRLPISISGPLRTPIVQIGKR